MGEDGDADEGEEGTQGFESLLDICLALGMVRKRLRWHYRSRREGLIAFSNRHFYGGELVTFPSADDAADGAVRLVRLTDGLFRDGANEPEARRVADLVVDHARASPDASLGVIAFSQRQQNRILDELEVRRKRHPELEDFFREDRPERFFVKNLENVQGDERDIIIFSIGYARDENGKFTLHFGPVNKAGGWRRLNVAFTRARRRIEFVSSIKAGDIGETRTEGVRHLKRYLDYAARGVKALAIPVNDAGGDAESPFEEEVLRVVRGWGFDAVPQVGTAGYRIDIGVRHPERPGQYVLGIECDGAMYHSSRVARDRDRLRQQVLEDLDWRLHRIWGTAWYRNRTAEEARLREAIEDAVAGRERPRVARPKAEATQLEVDEFDFDAPPAWTVPYVKSSVRAKRNTSMTDVAAGAEIERIVCQVAADEGPISINLCAQRVKEAFGAKYLSAPARNRVTRYIRQLVGRDEIDEIEDGFITVHGKETLVRVPSDADTRRRIDDVSWEELYRAISGLVNDAHRISEEDLLTAVARLFGWSRTAEVRNQIEAGIATLVGRGSVVRLGDSIVSGAEAKD